MGVRIRRASISFRSKCRDLMDCCDHNAESLDLRHSAQRKALLIALFLNLAMFFVEGIAGIINHSTGLLADSVDMLGDTGIYAVTILGIHRSARWQANASLSKGVVMALLAFGVFFEASHKLLFSHAIPTASVMGIVSVIALAVNVTCAWLLLKFRSDNLNMKSVWLCSRNDMLANIGVIVGGLFVALTNSALPDAIIGMAIASIELKSAASIISASRHQLKTV